jgi:hypothetical protein
MVAPTEGTPLPQLTEEQQLEDMFTYKAPHSGQPQRYENIRKAGLAFAKAIMNLAPKSPDRSVAIRCVREAVLWTNSAVANDGKY